MKKLTISLIAVFIAVMTSGCSIGLQEIMNRVISFEAPENDDTVKDLQRLSCVKVYSAKNETLINTVEDKETLIQFNHNTIFAEQWTNMDADDYMDQQEKIRQKLEEFEPKYNIVSYKTPAAIYNGGNLEKISEITIYKDTNMIMMQISPDTIKNFRVPSKYLVQYFEITDEVMDFLISLAADGEVSALNSNHVSTADREQDQTRYHIGNPRIDMVEIYSADGLIKTIKEQEICDEFQNKSAGSGEHYKKVKFNDVLTDLEAEYRYIAYKKSTPIIGNPKYEELFELVVYKNSTVMKMYTPQEAVPISLIKLSEEESTLVYEARDDVLEYLYSITSH